MINEILKPFLSIEQKTKNTLGIFTKTIEDLKAINQESIEKRIKNADRAGRLEFEYDNILVVNENMVKNESCNDLIINKIEDILNQQFNKC